MKLPNVIMSLAALLILPIKNVGLAQTTGFDHTLFLQKCLWLIPGVNNDMQHVFDIMKQRMPGLFYIHRASHDWGRDRNPPLNKDNWQDGFLDR